MNKSIHTPTSLLEAIKHFSDPDIALAFVASLRWADGKPVCPRCEHDETSFLTTRRIWKCKGCKKQFSVKLGTIFEDSPISLGKWLPALWMLVNAKNGISSYELARAIGVTQKTAWFMLHRIRLAMQTKSFLLFKGEVEADETFIGGRARNMHMKRKKKLIKGRGRVGKTAVMGLMERHSVKGRSQVRTDIIERVAMAEMEPIIRENVEPGSALYTDAHVTYQGMDLIDFKHRFIDHADTYVQGKVHTNGLENFWSLLKRAIRGTYISVEPFHLFRYLDEQAYRFNNRATRDVARFIDAMRGIIGKRLTYDELTGAIPTT